MDISKDVINHLIHLGGLAINGIFIGIVAISIYFLKRRWERRELRRKLAETLGVELVEIAIVLNPIGVHRAAIDPAAIYPKIPTAIYDGLVGSGNISNLDTALQTQLYRFYRLVEENHLKTMHEEIVDTVKAVENFRRHNSKH